MLHRLVRQMPALALLFCFTPSFVRAQETGEKWSLAQKPVIAAVEAFTKAFNKGDLKSLENFYTEDARLVTVDGAVFEGRDAILALFRQGMTGNPGLKLANDVRSVRLVGENVAIETGTSGTTTEADKSPKSIAYHVVHVKRDGAWKMFDVMETAPAGDETASAEADRLAVLDAIAGDWVEETETATVWHHARWSPSHKFLLIDYIAATGDQKPTVVSTQRIGWDPKSKSIRSWIFEEDGGYGTATWTPDPVSKAWKAKGESVLADGRVVSSTTLVDASAPGKVVIKSYDRTNNGQALDDAPIRTLVRKARIEPERKK